MPFFYLFPACVFCFCSFLFVVFVLFCLCFFCFRSSFVDVPLIFFCPADHVPDWQPRILLDMVEARSVNVKKTTTLSFSNFYLEIFEVRKKLRSFETSPIFGNHRQSCLNQFIPPRSPIIDTGNQVVRKIELLRPMGSTCLTWVPPSFNLRHQLWLVWCFNITDEKYVCIVINCSRVWINWVKCQSCSVVS